MKKCTVLLAVIALLTACGVSAQTSTPPPAQPSVQTAAQVPGQPPTPTSAKSDPWAGLRFLLGLWEAKTTGGVAQAQVSASYSFRMELRNHLMARHSRSGSCSAPDDFDCQHSDLLYIYPASNGAALEAIYFDNEGHVIHYAVSIPKPGTVVFLSDAAQPGSQYRLSYTFLDGVMSGQFEMKMPGQTEFTSYLEWSGKRQ
ncbi:MAG: hypothetical protein ABSB30_15540 [Terracidiphilus sp.]